MVYEKWNNLSLVVVLLSHNAADFFDSHPQTHVSLGYQKWESVG